MIFRSWWSEHTYLFPSNWHMAGAWVFSTVLALVICYVPVLNAALGLHPVQPRHLLPALPFCVWILGYSEARKWWIRRYPQGSLARETNY